MPRWSAKILTEAALIVEAMAKANSADRRFAGGKYRPDAHWDFALQLDADNATDFWNLLAKIPRSSCSGRSPCTTLTRAR